VDESVDGTPRLRTWDYAVDAFRHIAKVRVASSNLVIRSKITAGERPFSKGLSSFSRPIALLTRSTTRVVLLGLLRENPVFDRHALPAVGWVTGGRRRC
jgi:hypothetical protein